MVLHKHPLCVHKIGAKQKKTDNNFVYMRLILIFAIVIPIILLHSLNAKYRNLH